MSNYIVYRVLCIANGKSYIGCTSKPIAERMAKHLSDSKRRPKMEFHKAIVEHGTSNFKKQILHKGLTKSEAYAKEIEEIAKYNSVSPNGYNNTLGGMGNLGCLWLRGDADKLKLSETQKARWDKIEGEGRFSTMEARDRMSIAKLAHHVMAKPLIFRGVEYKSLRQAERATGLSMYSIRKEIATGEPTKRLARKQRPYVVGERTFSTRSEAAKFYGVSVHNLYSLLTRRGLL